MDAVTLTPDGQAAAITAAGVVIAAALALVGVWLSNRRTRAKVEEQSTQVRAKVEEVRVLAEPTGNGFADRVTSKLDEVIATVTRVEDRQLLGEKRADREAIARQHLADELAAYREQYARDHAVPRQHEVTDQL